jgi:hypothetical protein
MKKAGIIAFIVIIQFYLLPYRALYIYCAANHVSFSSVNNESKDNQSAFKLSKHNGINIGCNIPPKHNDRFADILSTPPINHSYNLHQLVVLQELLPAKQHDRYITPLILPNSSRGSPLV